MLTNLFVWLVFTLVAALFAARMTRLMVYDSFPPTAWFREKWKVWTADTKWFLLFMCHYCLAPWFTLVGMVAGWIVGIEPPGDLGQQLVWFVTAWLGLSYVASIVVAYDGDG